MNMRVRPGHDETRERIVTVAEEHFRRIGYAKTAVADIAAALAMSPANIYRYFASKAAINNAICDRLMERGQALAVSIAHDRTRPATERVRTLIVAVHEQNRAMLTDDRRIFDMVEVAMDQHWDAIAGHIRIMEGIWAGVIRDGISEGSFDPAIAPETMAATVLDACLACHHPTLIAQCVTGETSNRVEAMADFVLRALARRDLGPA